MILLCEMYRRRWYRKYQLGQDGVGLACMEFQKLSITGGIILALIKKNNNDDVINVLEKQVYGFKKRGYRCI